MISKAPKFKPRFRLHPVAILNSQRLRRSLADTYDQKSFYKYAIGLILLLLSIGSLYYTDKLVEELEQREEREVQLYAEGLRYVFNSPFDENFNVVYQVIQDAVNFYQIPAIYVNENNLANQYINISFPKKISPQEKERIIQEKLADMKLEHPPIPVELGKNRTGYIYYKQFFFAYTAKVLSFSAAFGHALYRLSGLSGFQFGTQGGTKQGLGRTCQRNRSSARNAAVILNGLGGIFPQ